MRYIFFGLIFLAVIFEVVADILFKKWALDHKNILFTIGMIVYLFGTVLWALSLKYEYLSRAGSIFTILNLVFLTLAGFFIFKENLSLINKIGIVLGIISVILIEI
jgi:multidrug transporter EmrE-like cation transporter